MTGPAMDCSAVPSPDVFKANVAAATVTGVGHEPYGLAIVER